jgi:hypothetical protein
MVVFSAGYWSGIILGLQKSLKELFFAVFNNLSVYLLNFSV